MTSSDESCTPCLPVAVEAVLLIGTLGHRLQVGGSSGSTRSL
jgi:hypothetical protein